MLRPITPMHSRAFTIIELLIVLGIILLLLAIALPAFYRARQSAHSVQCLSNLRQIGVALNAHLVDTDGVLPVLHNRDSVNDPLPALDTVLLPYANDPKVFACPSDEKELFATSGSSYFWNFTVNGQKVESLFSIIGGRNAERIPLALDKEGFHPELIDKVNILYADGHAANELRFSVAIGSP